MRAIWFADADGDRNCHTYLHTHADTYRDRYCIADTYCNNATESYTGSAIQAYPGAASVADALINKKSVIWVGRAALSNELDGTARRGFPSISWVRKSCRVVCNDFVCR